MREILTACHALNIYLFMTVLTSSSLLKFTVHQIIEGDKNKCFLRKGFFDYICSII